MDTIKGFLIAIILITGMAVAYCASQRIEYGTYSCAFICGMGLLALSITSLKKED